MESLLSTFVEAACAPLDSGHATGTLERAEVMGVAFPSGYAEVDAVLRHYVSMT